MKKWLPNFAELMDRLSIHQLKEVFIPDKKSKYVREMSWIAHDLDEIIKEKNIVLTGELIRLIIIQAQINVHIWYNESKARQGLDQDFESLKLTHSINGVRNRAGNKILEMIGQVERQDYKTDCLAAEHSQWDITLDLPKDE